MTSFNLISVIIFLKLVILKPGGINDYWKILKLEYENLKKINSIPQISMISLKAARALVLHWLLLFILKK